MNIPSDPEQLLRDVFEETDSAGFRDALLEQTLQRVRRRKRLRRASRTIFALAVVAGLPLVLWKSPKRVSQPNLESPVAPAYGVVASQPLDASVIVTTRPGGVAIIHSSENTVATIESAPASALFTNVNDEELLVLLGGHPAALVRGPGRPAELVFVNPADENGFPAQ